MPGIIIREILSYLKKSIPLEKIQVTDVRIGLRYTGIRLDDGHAGVCFTPSSELICCQHNIKAGGLAGSSSLEIAELANSWRLHEAAVGVATINALSQIILDKEDMKFLLIEGSNCIDEINIKKDDIVAMVGYIRPFIPTIRSKAKKLLIIERSQALLEFSDNILPDTACEEIVPESDIVIITGSSIVNGTLDRLLELSKNAREVALIGPTVSMTPSPLFERGATIIGGIKIINALKTLQIISEGGGVPQFKDTCKQIVFKKKV